MTTTRAAGIKRAIAVVQKDAAIRCKYRSLDGTCAIGGLMAEAGIPFPPSKDNGTRLRTLQRERMDRLVQGRTPPPDYVDALIAAYGLASYELYTIQAMNDAYETVEQRRAALIAYLSDLPEHPYEGLGPYRLGD